MWMYRPVISEVETAEEEFKVILGYLLSSRPVCCTSDVADQGEGYGERSVSKIFWKLVLYLVTEI